MKIFIGKNGQKMGPYSEEQLVERLNKGDFSYNDLAWTEEMKKWQPLRQVLPPQGGTPPPLSRASIPPPLETGGKVPPPIQQGSSSDWLGYCIVGIPLLVAILIWVGNGEGSDAWLKLQWGILAVLVGIDAKRLGAGSSTDLTTKGKKRAGPIGWGATTAFFGNIGACAYLHSRKRYGARSLLLPGLISTGVLLAAIMFPRAERSEAPMVIVPKDNVNAPEKPSILSKLLSSNQITNDELSVEIQTQTYTWGASSETDTWLAIGGKSEKPVTINKIKVNNEVITKWDEETEYKPFSMTMGEVSRARFGVYAPGAPGSEFRYYRKKIIKIEIETDRGTLLYSL